MLAFTQRSVWLVSQSIPFVIYGPRQANLVLIAYASSEGSGEPAHPRTRQNLRCSLIQAVSQEEPSDRKPDPWPLWMTGHAQLKFVMTECSKTQIRLTGLICWMSLDTVSIIANTSARKHTILWSNGVNTEDTTKIQKLYITHFQLQFCVISLRLYTTVKL